MRIQALLSMGQDRLSKEVVGELLDQRVHVLTSTQDLHHLTQNFVNLAGDYLGDDSPICLLMASWPRHIYRFERKYDKAFARDPLFGLDFMDCIHKRVFGIFILMQHDRHRGHGVGGPHGVCGASEKGRERGVVDFNAGMAV